MDALNRPTALVTGSSSGIGRALAERLAAEGWRVFVHGRNAERLQATLLSLDGNGHEVFRADMADLDAVRQLAADVEAASDRLDVLVHNAGGLFPSFQPSAQGVEMTVAVNALAPWVLTEALRPLLRQTADTTGGARIVVVSSDAHRGDSRPPADPAALAEAYRQPVQPYTPFTAYFRSKLATTAWALELARRLEGTGITVNACHPGLVSTGVFAGMGRVAEIFAKAFSPLYLTPEKGARAPFLLATDPAYAERTGRYVVQSVVRAPREKAPSSLSRDPEVGAVVWDALARLAAS